MSATTPDRAHAPAVPPAVGSAQALVADLVAHGMRDVVLAPGSRSAPLAYALAAAADAGALRLHVRVDERAAGFLALGLARGAAPTDGAPTPVAVVTTSGTAVANLHPAVLEAHHTGVPLVVLTADRPHELRGTGASQTTDQVGIFGTAVRASVDVPAPDGRDGEVRDLLATVRRALAAACGLRDRHPGPVHVDLAYRDPLQPAEPLRWEPATLPHAAEVVPPVPGPGADPLLPGDPARTLVVAGDGAGPAARRLAEARGWPLLAEPSSGACGGPHAVPGYRLLLALPELTDDVEHVVVLGHPTLSRPVQRLLAGPDVTVTVVAPGGGPWPDAARNAARVVDALADRWFAPATTGHGAGTPDAPSARTPFLRRWQTAGAAAAAALRATTDAVDGSLDAARYAALAVARTVLAATGPDDVLVVGASNPVRDVELALGLDDDPGTVLANRGLAGIDGTLSTATGVALATGRRTRVLVGDLTFLHDVGGLLRGPAEPAAPLDVVVVNDDGGSIFATLEHGALAATGPGASATFERVFGTPHGADLAALCAGYGVRHRLVPDVAALRDALATSPGGVRVLEVRVPRADRLAESRDLAARVADAARDGLRTAG
ncbi:2-succinyl-5-enolpyruvyl-6-hydroxy-3-cyclohexene-1-carboxylate synthase [Isoptericola jiangsuensis]|uniref:2-succinyl-5-enolpyruvyl-6-hydroxy-3-cyclohexene-1-carboxylate synthase n=1 Tax=Isoptericola jiangsuensis TaxID=548579 RepID=A0A2A9ESW7_9MICO|nr:2-succinyl-5-enolpyruvyl-6-hydroxy-3-cyclohexene-1-carboxylic-acid synthase [Isoptericola jiangsuensis]PFG42114.1 2-succinyl-5-enolpyruvyl-6-hydroxy-3-cyclohexene-1-carboxylate synthase [Isoptericola jiangsuensis]